MKIAIGIDTGGTCTDAVLYDPETGVVLQQAKALTTHGDLKQGILHALDQLDIELCRQAETAGLSTTLATNACVEGKFRRARLLLMGIDRAGVSRFGGDYGFADPNELRYLPCRTTISGQVLEEPDWAFLREHAQEWFRDAEGCAVCEIYGIRNGGVLEKQAAQILKEETGLPVVCASSLFGELASLERGAGALLNAGLLPIMAEFLEAVRAAFSERGIHAELFIVRSDSSLMGHSYAQGHPVETLLSGPAASALGGSVLTGEKRAVVVDMGGTTTDIALIEGGAPLLAESGIRVGGWRTPVHGVFAASFALGGDSAIRWERNGDLRLGPERVIPLCVLTARYPRVLTVLEEQLRETPGHSLPLHEFLTLSRPDWQKHPLTKTERQLCCALEDGPLSIQQAAEAVGVDRYRLSTRELETAGIVTRAGLTPTDIMHIRGDYSAYPKEASLLGGRFAAASMNISLKELCETVYESISREMFFGIARILLEQAAPYFRKHGADAGIQALLQLQWDQRKQQGTHLLSGMLQTSAVLVGVGGPVHLFLPEAARALGAEYRLPAHGAVANAVGAVSGQMTATAVGEVRPHGCTPGETGSGDYEVLCESTAPHYFKDEASALRWAEEQLRTLTAERIRARGGVGSLAYAVETTELLAPLGVGKVKLGTRIHLVASTCLTQGKGEH